MNALSGSESNDGMMFAEDRTAFVWMLNSVFLFGEVGLCDIVCRPMK